MSKLFIFPFIVILCVQFANQSVASEYFVSPTGDNNNNGTGLSDAFNTIQHAVNVASDGDIVWVADGTYNESVTITVNGMEDYPVIIKAINKQMAKLTTNAGNCFTVKSSYIEIDGFDLATSNLWGSGVGIDPGSHHITVKSCFAHDCGQSGIQSFDADYVILENNICTRNGWIMPYAGSGISVYGGFNSDNTSGLHNIVRNNICFNNDNGPETAMTDGNGIIIDDLKCTQDGHHFDICTLNGYNNVETLVEGNLCFDNGGRGIQIYLTENVTVRNNTCYHNNKRDSEGTWRGEIGVSNSDNLRIVNNIAVCNTDMGFPLSASNSSFLIAQYGSHTTTNIICNNNLTYNTAKPDDNPFRNLAGASAVKQADNLFATDPMFANAAIDSGTANFMLQEGSPAIDAGTLDFGYFKNDLKGDARVMRTAIDLGCYEATGDTLKVGFKLLKDGIENDLKLYPNPASGYINIQLKEEYPSQIFASILNMAGQKELQTVFNTACKEKLDIHSLKPGIYILEVSLNERQKMSTTFHKL